MVFLPFFVCFFGIMPFFGRKRHFECRFSFLYFFVLRFWYWLLVFPFPLVSLSIVLGCITLTCAVLLHAVDFPIKRFVSNDARCFAISKCASQHIVCPKCCGEQCRKNTHAASHDSRRRARRVPRPARNTCGWIWMFATFCPALAHAASGKRISWVETLRAA